MEDTALEMSFEGPLGISQTQELEAEGHFRLKEEQLPHTRILVAGILGGRNHVCGKHLKGLLCKGKAKPQGHCLQEDLKKRWKLNCLA